MSLIKWLRFGVFNDFAANFPADIDLLKLTKTAEEAV